MNAKVTLMNAKVDLLDGSREPSDEQLKGLMHSVAAEARGKAVAANATLMHTLREQVAQVCLRYHLSSDARAVAAA